MPDAPGVIRNVYDETNRALRVSGSAALDPLYSGRMLAYVENMGSGGIALTFDGTGGQVAGTYTDIPSMTTALFNVTTKPIRVGGEVGFAFVNGASTKFTGKTIFRWRVVCVTSPNGADVGGVVIGGWYIIDCPTASSTGLSTAFFGTHQVRSRLFTVGAGGISAGQVLAGTGYSFKMQATIDSVTNILARVTGDNTQNTPPCLMTVVEG